VPAGIHIASDDAAGLVQELAAASQSHGKPLPRQQACGSVDNS